VYTGYTAVYGNTAFKNLISCDCFSILFAQKQYTPSNIIGVYFQKKTLSECTFKKKHYRSARYKCRLLVVGGGEACAPAGVVEPEDCGPRPPARQEGTGLRGQVGGAGDAPLTWSTKVPRGDGKGDEGKPRANSLRRPAHRAKAHVGGRGKHRTRADAATG
jgi:hypothetical protein